MSSCMHSDKDLSSAITEEMARKSAEHVEAFISDNIRQLPFAPPSGTSLLDRVSLITDDLLIKARLAFAAGFPYRADLLAGVPASPPMGSSISGPSSLTGKVIDLSS